MSVLQAKAKRYQVQDLKCSKCRRVSKLCLIVFKDTG